MIKSHSTMSTFCENINFVPNETNWINLKWYKKNVHDWQNRCNETFADQESRQPSNQDDQQDHSMRSTFWNEMIHKKCLWATKYVEQLFCILKCEYMYIPDSKTLIGFWLWVVAPCQFSRCLLNWLGNGFFGLNTFSWIPCKGLWEPKDDDCWQGE